MITFVRKENDQVYIGLSRGVEYIVLPEQVVKDMCLAIITPPELPRCGMFAELTSVHNLECKTKFPAIDTVIDATLRMVEFAVKNAVCFEVLCLTRTEESYSLHVSFYIGLEEAMTIRQALGYA